jgi:(2S)-methylsuccinyl-CoA dehydrogenase
MTKPDLASAAAVVEQCAAIVGIGASHLARTGGLDRDQVVAYDLAQVASAVEAARAMLDYGTHGDAEAMLTCAFVADVAHDLVTRLIGREHLWGISAEQLALPSGFLRTFRDPAFVASLAAVEGPRHLDADFEMVQDLFRSFADKEIAPRAEHVHRTNADIPEEIIAGLAEIGAFGLSVPAEYEGFATGGEADYMGMVVATEELSRGSLGIGGSLITRPEILTRALVKGGTDAQKQAWLPRLAAGEIMAAVAVTEPDYGSDVAGLSTRAVAAADGGWLLTGVKTWCTFAGRADVLMLLARTDPDRTKAHRGLSLFIVPKPRGEAHGFAFSQTNPDGSIGTLGGRAIDTIGYRGMHSYEVAIDNWWVGDDLLIGGSAGVGRGFYYQMEGFENGRLQTAARAVGVMQAAYEAARDYAAGRKVFGTALQDYQLTQAKLGRMNVLIQAGRQAMYRVARQMAAGDGALQASMVKAYVCKAAEWVAREALQIHGGMGYAEEFPVSRLYVDARVLSIFEGADETLCLKVIARRLVEQAA